MGPIVEPAAPRAPFDPATRARLRAFARGELTWAEVEGLTFERATAIAQIGCDLAQAGRLEEARVIFEGLVTMNPSDSGAAGALGTVFQRLGCLDEALAAYDSALAADPDNAVALAHRGELRLRTGDQRGLDDLACAVRADVEGRTAASRRARAVLSALTASASSPAPRPP